MWRKTGQFILAYRFPLLLILIAATALMGYWASKVELSYEFSRAIPVNHPANKTYQAFKQKYGQDGNLLVIGIQTPDLFKEKIFTAFSFSVSGCFTRFTAEGTEITSITPPTFFNWRCKFA